MVARGVRRVLLTVVTPLLAAENILIVLFAVSDSGSV